MSNPFLPPFPKGKTSQSEAPNVSQSEVPNASQSGVPNASQYEIPKALQPFIPIGPISPIATPTTPPDATTSVPVSTQIATNNQSSSTQPTFTFTGDSTAAPTTNASNANYIISDRNTAVVAARIFGILIGITVIACGIALLMRRRTPRKKLHRLPTLAI